MGTTFALLMCRRERCCKATKKFRVEMPVCLSVKANPGSTPAVTPIYESLMVPGTIEFCRLQFNNFKLPSEEIGYRCKKFASSEFVNNL